MVIVAPDRGGDIADPPIEYVVDVTAAARAWHRDPNTNLGVALVPRADASVDDGHWTRFQVLASESPDERWVPRFIVEYEEGKGE